MLPLIARYLSPAEFGQMEVLASVAVFGSVIVGMGLESSLYKFCGFSEGHERKAWAANTFSLALVVGFVFAAMTPLISSAVYKHLPIDLDIYCLELVLYMLALESVIAVPLGWLRMSNQASLFCMISIGRVIVHASATVLFLTLGRGVAGVFEAGLLAALLQATVLTFFQIKSSGLHLNATMAKKSLVYSAPIVGSGLLAFSLNGLDRFIIATKIDIESVAIFSIAAKFSLALTILIQPFGMWWQPKRFAILSSDNGVQKTERYATFGLTLLISIFLVIGVVAPFVIHLIMPLVYHPSVSIFLGLLVAVFFKESVEFINIGCFKNDSTKMQFFIDLVSSGCCALLLLVGALLFGLWGVIGGLVSTQVLRAVLFFQYGNRVIRIEYPIKKLCELFILAMLLLTISYFSFYQELFSNTAETPTALAETLLACTVFIITLKLFWDKCLTILHIDNLRIFHDGYLRIRKFKLP